MKHIFLLSLIFSFAISVIIAQTSPVADYTFSQSEGTYTEITGGIVHGTETNDDESFNAVDLGFTFNYNGQDYTQIGIQTNGWIAMGSSVTQKQKTPLSDNASSNNAISVFGCSLKSSPTGELMSTMEGTAPNRIYTIQWKNYVRDYAASPNIFDEDILNFQLKLHETSNKIEFVYGDMSMIEIYDNYLWYMPQVGLRGNNRDDFNNRKSYFGELRYKWENTIIGTSYTNVVALDKWLIPQSGQTFIFVEPASYDVGITDLTNDRVIYATGNQDIIVSLKNHGLMTINSAAIKWQVNEGAVNTYNWSGSLISKTIADNINIGTYDFASNDIYKIEVWTESPNGNTDELPGNDKFTSFHSLNLYCGGTNIVYDEDFYIEDVTLGSITHLGGAGATYQVGDFSSHYNANYTPGSNLNYAIDVNTGGYLAFWIDYNDDNTFDESEYLETSDYFAFNETATGVLSLSESAPEGMHKLRVRFIFAAEGSNIPTAADACTPLSSFIGQGDAHDYGINIYTPTTPPNCVSNPYPANTTTDVFRNIALTWESEASTNFDVYFGTSSTPPLIQNQTENTYTPSLLSTNTTYYWQIIAYNEHGSASGCSIWSFTTGEDVGYCIPPTSDCDEWSDNIDDFYMEDLIHENSSCSPNGYGDYTDGAFTTNLAQGANITWSANYGSQDVLGIWIDFNDDGTFNQTDEFVYHTEPVDDAHVYIDSDNFNLPGNCQLGTHRMRVRAVFTAPPDITNNQLSGVQACTGFAYSETHDYIITIIEPTEAPQCAENPSPENGAIDQFLNTELTWTANLATAYDVYFGTTTLDYIGEVNSPDFSTETLEPNTTYQWKIIPKNNIGSATDCDIWTFTTSEELNYCENNLYLGGGGAYPCDFSDYMSEFSVSDFSITGLSCNDDGNVQDHLDQIIDLEQGAAYTWEAILANQNQAYIAIWLDINNDGTFSEDELLYTADEVFTTYNCSGNITIPAYTPLGNHRFRLRTRAISPIGAGQACTPFDYGQAYDFTANITEITTEPTCVTNQIPVDAAIEQQLNLSPLSWTCDFATEFDVYFGTETAPALVSENQTELNYETGTLEPNTTYYWKVIPSNIIGGPSDCTVLSFTTSEILEYCTNIYSGDQFGDICAYGDNIDDFIVNDFEDLSTACNNTSGYEDFSSLSFDLARGETHNWTITTENNDMNHVAIWIDYDNDGTFNNSNEFIYSTDARIPLSYSDTLAIDISAELGEHRFRVRLKSQDPTMTGNDACTNYTWGETHDYTVNITNATNNNLNYLSNNNIELYPNPAANIVFVKSKWKIKKISVYNNFGQAVITQEYEMQDNYETSLNTNCLKPGLYNLLIETEIQAFNKKLTISR